MGRANSAVQGTPRYEAEPLTLNLNHPLRISKLPLRCFTLNIRYVSSADSQPADKSTSAVRSKAASQVGWGADRLTPVVYFLADR